MAVDTRDKRASVLNLTGTTVALPLADGSVNQGDRQHVGMVYRGVTAAAPGGTTITAQLRQNFQLVFGRIFGRVN